MKEKKKISDLSFRQLDFLSNPIHTHAAGETHFLCEGFMFVKLINKDLVEHLLTHLSVFFRGVTASTSSVDSRQKRRKEVFSRPLSPDVTVRL